MILSVTLSKPVNNIEETLGKPYTKIKIRAVNTADGASYAAEMFTKTQVFHKKFSETELDDFLAANAGVTFKNCVKRTESEEIALYTQSLLFGSHDHGCNKFPLGFPGESALAPESHRKLLSPEIPSHFSPLLPLIGLLGELIFDII